MHMAPPCAVIDNVSFSAVRQAAAINFPMTAALRQRLVAKIVLHRGVKRIPRIRRVDRNGIVAGVTDRMHLS